MTDTGFRASSLRSYITRIERMDEEIEAAKSDRTEIFNEAKAVGFDTKIMRMVIRIRKMDQADYEEQCAMLDLYLGAMKVPADVAEAAREALRDEPEQPGAVQH